MTDMHKRADNLRAFISDLRHVETEHFEDLEIDLDGEIPKMPYRYVASEYSEDREGTYLEFAGSLEEARRSGATGWVVDLDTGDRWEIELHATLHPIPWTVKTTSRLSNAVSVVRYRTEKHAQAYVDAVSDTNAMPHDEEGPFVTVLDGPTYEWHGEPPSEQPTARELADRIDRFDREADADSEADREGFMDDARALARLVLESEDA